MSDQDVLPAHVHPEAALLPWYLNRTLDDSQRMRLETHLKTCSACRNELEELTQLHRGLSAHYAAEPGPSRQQAAKVLEAIRRETVSSQAAPPVESSWLGQIDGWLRSLLQPRWAPTLAAALLLIQIGLLLTAGPGSAPPDQVSTRALGMQTATFFVTFESTATDGQIRSLLRTVNGRIVDGPTADGVYAVEVPAADANGRQTKLNALRADTTIVRSVETERH